MKTNTQLMEPGNYRNNSRIWTGFFLVAAGFLLLARKLGAPVPVWLISWPVALVVLGALLSIRHRFRNPAGLILILIGGLNLLDQLIPDLHLRNYSGPLIIIAFGLLFIFMPKNMKWRHRRDWSNFGKKEYGEREYNTESGSNASRPVYEGLDYIEATSILGGVKKIVLSKNFKGGDITCFMGGAEIDLTQADIQNDVVLDVTAVFGGCKLLVPANWNIKSDMTVVLGGIDDKREVRPGNTDAGKVLILQGTAVFGGIEIQSF